LGDEGRIHIGISQCTLMGCTKTKLESEGKSKEKKKKEKKSLVHFIKLIDNFKKLKRQGLIQTN